MDIERFRGLIAIQKAIAAARGDLSLVMQAIVSERSVIPQSNGIVVELRDGDQLYYAAASGTSATSVGLRLPLDSSLSGSCILGGEPLYCADAHTDPRVNRPACDRVGLRSMIVVPIPHNGQVIGVLKYHASEPHAYDHEDILIAQLLVGPITVGFSSVAEADAIRAKVELQTLVDFKEQLISTVSHELRTPLTSIIGSLSLLDNGIAGSLSERAAQLIQIASRNANRLSKLINDLLDIDRIDSGKLSLTFATELLQDILTTVAEENQPFIKEAGSELVLTMPDIPLYVSVDRDRLFQAITNLISNAAKFSPAGSLIQLVLAADDTEAKIYVSDAGPGIPEAFRPRLFDRFSQSSLAPRLANMPGSGLGLAIAKGVVEQLGGTLHLDESCKVGSTFIITLPLAHAK